MSFRFVTIIPARGGSKGIPNKNIVKIKGLPLINYSVNASLKSKVGQTYVCTDDETIALEASKAGAEILMRPAHLADDIIMPDPTLEFFAGKVDFDFLVFIQPTSPLIKFEYINEGIELMKTGNFDSVFSVTEEHWIPRWDSHVNPKGWKINNRPRRQDRELSYVENGMLYITTRENLQMTGLRYGGKMGFIKIPLKDSFQVDSIEDLDLIKKII